MSLIYEGQGQTRKLSLDIVPLRDRDKLDKNYILSLRTERGTNSVFFDFVPRDKVRDRNIYTTYIYFVLVPDRSVGKGRRL